MSPAVFLRIGFTLCRFASFPIRRPPRQGGLEMAAPLRADWR